MNYQNQNKRYDELAQKLLEGNITPEEKQEYADWLNEDDGSLLDIPVHFVESRKGLEERMLVNLHKEIMQTSSVINYSDEQQRIADARVHELARPFKVYNRRWWMAAASILIVLGVSMYAWFSNSRVQHVTLVKSNNSLQSDILPGDNKAILTLADGTIILLDSAANGTLVQQGGAQVVKLANGQLVYKTTTPSAANVLYNTMTTPRGGQYRLTLPDGTGVWLNASSSINYPTVFTGSTRTVTVTGEVYFEVTKNAKMPFHVKVSDMEVEVLGTNFNINSYTDEGSVKTTLLEGSIKVSRENENVLLKPGQQAVVASSGQEQKINVVNGADAEEVMAWKEGYFQFNETDLKVVMRQLERWYDVEVVYEGKVPKETFIGQLPRDATLSQILRVLSKTQVHFRIEGKKIIVTP